MGTMAQMYFSCQKCFKIALEVSPYFACKNVFCAVEEETRSSMSVPSNYLWVYRRQGRILAWGRHLKYQLHLKLKYPSTTTGQTVLKQAVISDFPPETTENGQKSYYGNYKKKPTDRRMIWMAKNNCCEFNHLREQIYFSFTRKNPNLKLILPLYLGSFLNLPCQTRVVFILRLILLKSKFHVQTCLLLM